MAQNLWHTGAADNVYAPYEWSNGAPQPGDTLVIGSGTAFLDNGNVYGDTVVLSGEGTQPTLIAYGSATDVSVLVAYEAADPTGAAAGGSAPTGVVDVIGAPQVSLDVQGSKETDSNGTVNIEGYSQMRGGFTGEGDNAVVTINGTTTSNFANTASSLAADSFAVADINAYVSGAGTFGIGADDTLRFTSGVSSGQTINDDGGSLTIADARDFQASVDWSPAVRLSPQYIEVSGLMADHSSYANGVLSLTSGGSDVFDFHVQTTSGSGVVAAQTSGGIQVFASAADASAANAVLIAHS